MRARFQPPRRLTVIAPTRVCVIAESAVHCRWANTHGAVGGADTTMCQAPVVVSTIGAVGMQAVTAISVGGQRTPDVIGGKAHGGRNDFGEPVDNTTIDRPPSTLDASRILAGAAVTAISTREPVTGNALPLAGSVDHRHLGGRPVEPDRDRTLPAPLDTLPVRVVGAVAHPRNRGQGAPPCA